MAVRTTVHIHEVKEDSFHGTVMTVMDEKMDLRTHSEEELGRLRKDQLRSIETTVGKTIQLLEDAILEAQTYLETVENHIAGNDKNE